MKIKILALGSSITKGYGNNDISFVEMLNDYKDEEISFDVKKEAINGTTLANLNAKSYLARLRNYSYDDLKKYDYVLIQLSTNDIFRIFRKHNKNPEKTTIGAIEVIFDYLRENFSGKIIFYTCFMKRNSRYENLINSLKTLQNLHIFQIFDFYNDNEMLNSDFKNIMSDNIHPNENGYKIMTKKIVEFFKIDQNQNKI